MRDFPRIARILGITGDEELDEAVLERLVTNKVDESEDLEFKRTPYPSDDKLEEVAKDVASFANHRGGVIVIGMAESQGKASQAQPFDATDNAKRRLDRLIADHAHPLPRYETLSIPSREKGKGYFVIKVPQSPLAPHATSSPGDRDRLTYWVRHGSQTIALSESEIADRYRRRISRQREVEERLHDCLADGLKLLSPEMCWLALALTPETSGQMNLRWDTPTLLRGWMSEIEERPWNLHDPWNSIDRAVIGLRRCQFIGIVNDDGFGEYRVAELHSDGSGFLATSIGRVDVASETVAVTDSQVVLRATLALRTLAEFASVHCGCSGDGDLGIHLVSPIGNIQPCNVRLYMDSVFPERIDSGPGIPKFPFSSRTISIDGVVSSRRELVVASRLAVLDIFQTLGQPGPRQFGADGTVFPKAFGQSEQSSVRTWAETHGVPISDAPRAT